MSPDISHPPKTERRLTPEYVAARALAESATLAEAASARAAGHLRGARLGPRRVVERRPAGGVLRCVETWHLPTAQSAGHSTRSAAPPPSRRASACPDASGPAAQPAWIPDVAGRRQLPARADRQRRRTARRVRLPDPAPADRRRRDGVLQPRDPRARRGPARHARQGRRANRSVHGRKRAEEELDRFFSLSLDCCAWRDSTATSSGVNPAWERVLGYTPDELLRAPVSRLRASRRSHVRRRAWPASSAGGGQVIAFENRYRAKDGTIDGSSGRPCPYPTSR